MNLVFELASARVPASLADVRTESAAPDDGAICYRISCPCGGALGSVTSEYDEPEDFWVDPIVFTCADCGRSETIFDSSKHGYDAVLNSFSAYEPRTKDEQVDCPGCGGGRFGLVGYYRYNFEDGEIEQWWSEEDRARMPDLFDSVAFRLTCGACGEAQWVGGYECA
jgi:ribosomal protein S27E